MKLIRFNYRERTQQGEDWQAEELALDRFNLIVGRNATGKSRLLRAIARAAADLTGQPHTSTAEAHFEVAVDEDSPEAKEEWARRAQYFPFAGEMLFKRPRQQGWARLDLAETYKLGCDTFGSAFEERTLQQMERVGYQITQIILVDRGPEARSLEFKEPKRRQNTAFRHLSQAQQRTLALFVLLTFLELEQRPATLLVDDFAEGLDFERARRLAEVVLKEYANAPLQFIIATNDRYVMNAIPLEHWTVLVEHGTTTRVFNYQNSKQQFDDFKFTGLNNFDFFSMDFAREPA